MEIFDHRLEYFKVLFWCIRPPTIDELAEKAVSFTDLEKQYKPTVSKLVNSRKDQRDFLLGLIGSAVRAEEERGSIIETKASSIISQTGLAVTLLVASLSIVSIAIEGGFPKFAVLCLVCLAAVQLIAAGLHARHVVTLSYMYPAHDITSYFRTKQPSTDFVISQLFIIKGLSRINNVKATFLKFSHWFYKATFVLLFLIVLLVPVLFLFRSS